MELSVIIVSYNVSDYLVQCLNSLVQALQPFDKESEVWIVDNASTDSSRTAVREWMIQHPDFPLKWIGNADNVGFGRANNQAVQQASGRFLLFLNPDTVISDEVLEACRDKMHSDPQCGAIGVRMLNAEGRFLPESKRGFPDPFTSFCKLTRLYRLFPNVKRMNHYYLPWLNEHEEQQVEVLAGAFMYVRRTESLDQEGYFDERFFMYGEDIDLSYRITRSHTYHCTYLPIPILHYKGESTDATSLHHIRVFYGAMELFHQKYYRHSLATPFVWLGVRAATILAAAKQKISAARKLKNRCRKAEKPLPLFCLFTSTPTAVLPALSPGARHELCLFPAVPLDYASVAECILPQLREKRDRTVHLVWDMKAYRYSAVLDFLNSGAWHWLQTAAAESGNRLLIAFASGRNPLIVVTEAR